MRDEADRVVGAGRLDDASATFGADLEEDPTVERALLAYAQRSAARVGAEWFAAEFARREEDDRLEREHAGWPPIADGSHPDPSPNFGADLGADFGLIDASVEDDVIGGAPAGLGLAPMPKTAGTG
jgi:hypothetical protein